MRALTVATAAVGAVLLASPAFAVNGDVDLNDGPLPTTAGSFDDEECDVFDDDPLNIQSDEDGWHFTLGAAGDDFVSVTLNFTKPDTTPVVATITAIAPAVTSGADYRGFLKEAGDSDKIIHAYVITEAGWTLQSGTAEVTNFDAEHTFQLSHTCPGTPGTETTTTTTTTTTTRTDSTPPTTTTDPGLPVTGGSLTGIVLAGLALVGGGTALLIARRRRAASETPAA